MACRDRTGKFRELLLRFAEHGGDPLERARLIEHLKECQECREKLDDIRRFITISHIADKNIWGEKSPCPSADELVTLSDSPRSIPPARLDEIKKHLLECFSCNEDLRKLINLNKQMKLPDFERKYPLPSRLKGRLKRLITERSYSALSSGTPALFDFGDDGARVSSQACFKTAGRKPPADQSNIPIFINEISGVLKNESGEAIRSEYVTLVRNSRPVYRAITNNLGRFNFRNLLQGFYELKTRDVNILVIVKRSK